MKGLIHLLMLGSVLAWSACVRSAKSKQDPVPARWYADEREVPALELKYESVLAVMPQGEDMRKRLCFGFDPQQAQDFDRVRRVFCQEPLPKISSLRELQAALGLAIPEDTPPGREHNGRSHGAPGWALTGHSTSLVSRFVSPINPRVILFTTPQDASTPIADFVVMGFVRGDQFVELIAREPKSGKLNFFLLAFKQACSEQGHCSTGHLQSAALESNWLSLTVYEDTFLANTVFDCTHCHQPDGPQSPKMLRMQEIQQPWSHFFRDDTQGKELIQIFHDFHGPDEGVGGIPAKLIASSDPEKLARLLEAQGFAEQPNAFKAAVIEEEIKQTGGPGLEWSAGWQHFVQGKSIAFPSWANSILDAKKLPDIKNQWQKATNVDERPDLRMAVDDRLGPSYGVRAPLDATGAELVALTCQRCHHAKLDPDLGKSLFRADVKPSERSFFATKNAIDRLEILRKDPSNPLAMPPRLFMDLTDSEIDRIITELKAGRDL